MGPGSIANPLLEATGPGQSPAVGSVPQFAERPVWRLHHGACKERGWRQADSSRRPWRRRAGKVACRLVSARAATLLARGSSALGSRGGTEAGCPYACRTYVENMPQGHAFVKIDFTNAQHPAA